MAMKPSLGVAVNLLLSVATVGLADECHNICADLGKGISFKSACSAFRNSLPRPKISRKCQAGFKAAVELNCYDACINGGYLQPYVYERRLDEACAGTLKETPRVLCHDACVQGYRSGAQDMSTSLIKRMAKAAPTVLAALKEDTTGGRQTARNARITATLASTAVERNTKKATPTVSAGLKVDTTDRQQSTSYPKPVEQTLKARTPPNASQNFSRSKVAPTVLEGLKEDPTSRQQAKKGDHPVVAPAGAMAVKAPPKEITGSEAEVTSPSQSAEADSPGAGALDTQEQEAVANSAAESQQPAEKEEVEEIEEVKDVEEVDQVAEIEEVEGVDEEGERQEEHVTEEDPRRPAGGIEDEFENEDNAAVDGDGDVIDLDATGNEHGTNQGDIYTWIEDEDKILLSLPITVDNVEKELTIFEGDEPIDVVMAFCRDNMPGEGACTDELLTVVQDTIFPDRAQEEKLS